MTLAPKAVMPRQTIEKQQDKAQRHPAVPLFIAVLASILFGPWMIWADSASTNQIGQGVVYMRFTYKNLYTSTQQVYVVDVNLNDSSPSVRTPFRTGGATRTVSQHAATVPGAVACVNGDFFSGTGGTQFLKVNGVIVNGTQSGAQDQQALINDGLGPNSASIVSRPPITGTWSNLNVSNIIACGPGLIQDGVPVTQCDDGGSFCGRNPRTAGAWTFNNHLLLFVIDGRSSVAAGMSLVELRDYIAAFAPVRQAVNFDGGGSSTMWISSGVQNVPSDGIQRGVANAIAIAAAAPAVPATPINLVAVLRGENILLEWPVSSGAMSYTIKRSTTNGGPYGVIGSSIDARFTDTNIVIGKTYYYVVRAVNQLGQSVDSTSVKVDTSQVAAAPNYPYADTVIGLGAVGYWPLQETNVPASFAMETNLGTLGFAGDAIYAATNSSAVTFGMDSALASDNANRSVLFNSARIDSYAFVPRTTPALTIKPPFSLECWVNPSATASTQDLISLGGSGKNSPAGSGNYAGFRLSFGGGASDGHTLQFFAYTGNGVVYNVGSTNIQTPAESVSVGQWHHCVATYDGTTVLLYVDGQLQMTGKTSMAIDTWSPLTIGTGRWQGKPTRGYCGMLDEVAIYTNVLGSSAIIAHYNIATNAGASYRDTILSQHPLLYYRMDCAGYVAPDLVLNPIARNLGSSQINGFYQQGSEASATSGPALVGFGTSSLSVALNGVFSCVNAGFHPDSNPTGTQSFSIAAWFQTYPSDGSVQTIMSHGTNSWSLNLDGTTGKLVWNSGAGNVTSSSVLNDGVWHQVVAVHNASVNILYIDGTLRNSAAASGAVVGNVVDDVFIGGDPEFLNVTGGERFFAGAVAQAAFFTNALTTAQVQQLYVAATVPMISSQFSGGQFIINYSGTLLSSTNLTGPYTSVSAATSPYATTPTGAQMFYRTSN